jgi:quinol monooxygenase YgiN
MDTKTVRLVVHLAVHEGNLDAVGALAKQMIAASEKEPGTLGYEWYLNQNECRILETYFDAAAVLAHFRGPVVGEMVPPLLTLEKLELFEVYGDPGAEAGALIASLGAAVFAPWQGMSR